MRKSISINDVDCSTIFTRYGYSVSYTKIRGAAGGTMLDGSTTEDVIAIKAVVTLSFMPQTEEELLQLENATLKRQVRLRKGKLL